MPKYLAEKPLNYKNRFYDAGKTLDVDQADAARLKGYIQPLPVSGAVTTETGKTVKEVNSGKTA